MSTSKEIATSCPFCGSSDLDFPTDPSSGEIQFGPAYCYSCNAYQDADGDWLRPQDGNGES